MRTRLHALLACLALSCGAHAREAPDWVGGFLLADHERTGLRASVLNVDNFVAIPEAKTGLVGLLEGRYRDVTWRTRLEAQRTDAAGQASDSAITLQELNRVFRLGAASTLSLGKRLYALDPSYINQPLGFFQKRSDLSDPLDALGQAEGVPMAVLSWTDARASLAALYSKDRASNADGYNRGVEQSLLKLAYEFDRVSASVLVRRASGESHGIGATLNATLGDTLSCYGSAYSAKGTQRPIVNTLLELPSADAVSSEPALGFYRANDGKRYHRATVGLVYTPPEFPKIQLEYAYDGRGLSDTQYARLLEQIQRNQDARLPDIAIKARQAVLSQLFVNQGMRRRYLSLTLAKTLAHWELSGGVYVGLDDRGKVWHAVADYKLTSRLSVMLSAVRQDGADDSERALSPVGRSVAARLRWVF